MPICLNLSDVARQVGFKVVDKPTVAISGVLPDDLLNEMREAFKRSEVFLDLELREEDPLLKQKDQMQKAIAMATPEQLGQMQEMFQKLGIGNIVQASNA
ncbi:MAG: hypothetical protein AB1753_08250 [Thermoproteota archaeon]